MTKLIVGKFKVVTLGCKVNQYESAYLEESLRNLGWERADRSDPADLVVVNTCIVTGSASCQSRQEIRRAIRENPGAVVAATGCYAQVYPGELEEIPGLHLVAGNTFKGRLPEMTASQPPGEKSRVAHEEYDSGTPFEFLPVRKHPGRTRAFLKIQDGCRSFCSYCIVPYARGNLRSLPPEKVVEALTSFGREGFQEVVLTGIHLGKYGVDQAPRTSLLELTRRICREDLPLRVRLSSLEPEEISSGLVDLAAEEPRLCPHFHIPLQSGDDRVLGLMNRGYTARGFSETVLGIRRRLPYAAVGVDVMVGFPGESDEAFENTLSLVEAIPVSYLHVFRYSPRPGTPAASFVNKVPQSVAKKRAAVMRSLGSAKRRLFHESCLGRVFSVLVEDQGGGRNGRARGFAENYLSVTFPNEGVSMEKPVPVRVEKALAGGVSGRVV